MGMVDIDDFCSTLEDKSSIPNIIDKVRNLELPEREAGRVRRALERIGKAVVVEEKKKRKAE